jgi:signal peptidase I
MPMTEVEEKQAKEKHEETPLEAFASICGVLAVGLFVLTFIFQNFAIPSSSMVKALLVGDHVLVDRITLAPPAAYAPFVNYRNVQHGVIIVFYKPTLEPNGEHLFLVKRVMGLPGDRIHLRDAIVYRNGVALDEPYAAKPSDLEDVLRHGRQPHRQPRQPLLGIRSALEHRGPPPVRLLVL